MELCAFYFHKAVKDRKSMLLYLKEIYLVLRNEDDEQIIVEMFSDAINITQRPLLKQSNSFGSNKKFAKTLTSKPEEEETCCICMDTPNNPKKLHKCGHVFCTGCIEESFKYKPACPSCGQIYGKMTGDQPTGTISIKKEHQTLEGFSDCKGTIVLTYLFYGGRQGVSQFLYIQSILRFPISAFSWFCFFLTNYHLQTICTYSPGFGTTKAKVFSYLKF